MYPYGYGQGWSPVPSAFGGLGQAFQGVAQSAYQWLPLIAQMQQQQDQTTINLLQQGGLPDEQKRALIGKLSPRLRNLWPKETVPGAITTPGQPAITAPAPVTEAQAPGAGLDVISQQAAQHQAGSPTITAPAVPEVRAPSTERYWVPPVSLDQQSVEAVLGPNNPVLNNMPEAMRKGRWGDLDPEIKKILSQSITAPFVWGTPGQQTPAQPGTVPAPATPVATPGAPGQPMIPPTGAAPTQPGAPQAQPAQSSTARVNPTVVAGARGKNAAQLSAAEILETRGIALTPEEETALLAIPVTNFQSPRELEAYLGQMRAQQAGLAEAKATTALRSAEATGVTQRTGLEAEAAKRATAKEKQAYYIDKAFGVMFNDPQNAPARLAAMQPQMLKDGVQPDTVMAGARTMFDKARTGQPIDVQIPGPGGKPITVAMTGTDYARWSQENRRLAFAHNAESLNRLKFQVVERAMAQIKAEGGDPADTSKWPDDVRVLMGFEPKPTSPQAIRNLAIKAAQQDLRWIAIDPADLKADEKRLAIVNEYMQIYSPQTTPPPPPPPPGIGEGVPGAKPTPAPLDPKVTAALQSLRGPGDKALADAAAWAKNLLAGAFVGGPITPMDVQRLSRIATVWPTLDPAQRRQLSDVAKIPIPWAAWLDKHAPGPGGPTTPLAAQAAVAQTWPSALPPPSPRTKNKRITLTDGTIWRSDGTKWEQVK